MAAVGAGAGAATAAGLACFGRREGTCVSALCVWPSQKPFPSLLCPFLLVLPFPSLPSLPPSSTTYLGRRRDHDDEKTGLCHTRGLDGGVVRQELAVVNDLLTGGVSIVVLGLELAFESANGECGFHLDKHLFAPHVLDRQLHLARICGVGV